MNHEEFAISLEKGHLRSKALLLRKAKEYAGGESGTSSRLIQFYKLGIITNKNPQQCLVELAAKHFSSICDMADRPDEYSKQQWREKITDLRNYTHLLDALMEENWE